MRCPIALHKRIDRARRAAYNLTRYDDRTAGRAAAHLARTADRAASYGACAQARTALRSSLKLLRRALG
jgi:hypothetical protein